MWILAIVVVPLVVGVFAAALSGEATGRMRRHARADAKRAAAMLPEPEASRRAEEWAAQIADLDGEPIAAFFYAKRLRRDAVQMVGELSVIAEGGGGEVSTGLRPTKRRPAWPRLVPRFMALLARCIKLTGPMWRRSRALQGRILPNGWLDAIRQVSLFGAAYVVYRLVRDSITTGVVKTLTSLPIEAWAVIAKVASSSMALPYAGGLALVACGVWWWRRRGW
jgi:hypothetical protein